MENKITQEELFTNFKEEMKEHSSKREIPTINNAHVFQNLQKEMKKLDAAYRTAVKQKKMQEGINALYTDVRRLSIPIQFLTKEISANMKDKIKPSGFSVAMMKGEGSKISASDEAVLERVDKELTEKEKQARLFVTEGKPVFQDGFKAIKRHEEKIYQEQTAAAAASVANLGQLPTTEEINSGYGV